ncbi:MAG TPA: efflux RND transporter periplasmic adaptor subunit [Chthoniobacterales bacterium]|nr:efflux RND transporter periplasmic adaptor subunit [Chthoniobacterales bacterium]
MDGSILEIEPEKSAQPKSSADLRSKARHSGAIKLTIVVFLAGFSALAVLGITSRSTSTAALQQETNQAAEFTVAVVTPEKAPATVSVDLPGQTQAYIEAPIFAQTTGYLKKWYFDIGAKVKAGEVLAEIDTPQVDEDLKQAKANLRQAQAALDLSLVTYKRDQDLLDRKVIAQQDFDTASSDLHSKQATVNANAAAVSRLQALEDFKIVKAPFDGTVTRRNTDIGQIVNSGSGTPLFDVAQVSPLRIYVNVPEAMASYVRVGGPANVTFNEFPGQKFPGQVVRTAQAIDPASRTLLTEVDVANDSGQLFPGAYSPVHLETEGPASLLVPSSSLLFRSEGASLGVVGPDNRVHLKKIKIGRDLGGKLEIVNGVSPTDRIVVNPGDSLAEGMLVHIQESKEKESQRLSETMTTKPTSGG